MRTLKTISVLLCTLIVIYCFSPVALATSIDTTSTKIDTKEKLDFLGCKIFPEHKEKILGAVDTGAPSAMNYMDDSNKVVLTETRSVSDSSEITYVEYANGATSLVFWDNIYLNSSSSGSGYSSASYDISVDCSFSAEFVYIRNFEYTVQNSAYDVITNRGSSSSSTAYMNSSLNYFKLREDANGPATAKYQATFTPSDSYQSLYPNPIPMVLYIYVGGDDMWYEIY